VYIKYISFSLKTPSEPEDCKISLALAMVLSF